MHVVLTASSPRTSPTGVRSANIDTMQKTFPPFALLCAVICAAAPPPKCKVPDIPVRVAFGAVYDPTGELSRINNDVAAAYEDGKDGVYARFSAATARTT